MVSEKDFHTEEVEFSTKPPIWVPIPQPKIHYRLIGKIPNWLNLLSWPVRTMLLNYQFYGNSFFKVDKNLSRDLQNYYVSVQGEFVGYSEKILLETSKSRQPIVVSPGVWFNAETDQYFIRKYDAKVIGVDPTPIVTKYIDYCYKIGYFTKEQYILEPSALSSKVGTTEFSFDDEAMIAVYNRVETKLKVKTVDLNYILDKYKLPAIDLLQIDIEGGEYDVIDHFEDIKVPIPQICIEFHNVSDQTITAFLKNKQMKNALQKLRSLGYRLVASYEPWYQANPIFNALLIHHDYLK